MQIMDVGGMSILADPSGAHLSLWEPCDASVARAGELEAQAVKPQMDIPQGRFAIIADPQGAMIHLMKVLAPN